MDWNPRRYLPLLGLTVLAIGFATSACTNTEYVEVEQPRFNPAPDSVAGFLGPVSYTHLTLPTILLV